MDCQSCEAMLLDLAYGELAPQAQSEARAHLSRCAPCRELFEQLSAGRRLAEQLPLVEAPSELSQRLLEAARARPVSQPARIHIWQVWGAAVRRVAFSRQLAMATMMVLILTVGLLSLPQLSHRPEAAGGTVVNPDHAGEAGPSAAREAAKPLDLAIDARTGRIRAKSEEREDLARPRPAAPGAASPTDEPPMPASQAEPEPSAPAFAPPPAAAPSELAAEAEPAAKLAAPANLAEAEAKQDAPRRAEIEGASVAPDNAAVGLAGANGGSAAASAAASSGTAAPAAAVSSSARRMAADDEAVLQLAGELDRVAVPAAEAPAPQPRAHVSGAGAPAALAAAPAAPTSSAGAAALLHAARNVRAAGHCEQAVTSYRAIVEHYPTSPQAVPALREALGCYDQLRQPARAAQLLTIAAQAPALTALANQTMAARRQTRIGSAAAAKPASTASPARAADLPGSAPSH